MGNGRFPEIVRDFVLLLMREGLEIKRSFGNWDPLATAILGLRDRPTQAFVEVIFALLQAGAPLDSIMKNEKAEFILRVFEPIRRGPGMVIQNEHCSRARSSSQISAGPVAPGLRIENMRAKTCCGCAV